MLVFFSGAVGNRGKILSKIFYARSAAPLNMSHYEGKTASKNLQKSASQT
ncbi:hypothetical protein QUB61_35175 [Microcoleus sp. C2D2]